MIVLKESVDINAPFQKLYDWVMNLENEFIPWSPYHTEFELLSGGKNVGDNLRFVEVVEGIDYHVTGEIVENIHENDSFRFSFKNDKGTAFISFIGDRTKMGCRFTHIEEFGLRKKFIGPIINFLIFKVFFKKKANWQLIRDDMSLDNRYLMRILEEGIYPDRVNVRKK